VAVLAVGARLLTRLSGHRLESALALLLVMIGLLILAEAYLPSVAGAGQRTPGSARRAASNRSYLPQQLFQWVGNPTNRCGCCLENVGTEVAVSTCCKGRRAGARSAERSSRTAAR
jgi:hypothetical protein